MNPILSTPAFWQPYLTLEPENLSQEDFSAQLDALGSDYPVRDTTVAFEYQGRQCHSLSRVAEFSFPCGDRFSLTIDYQPSVGGCEKTLFLADAISATKHQLGWWDLARWHPFCLRADELYRLLTYWRRRQDTPETVQLPLLLLCRFVGLVDADELQTLQTQTDLAFRVLGIRPPAGKSPVRLAISPHYRWELNKNLGWIFTRDDYPCYSLRNPQHADSSEGHFPFSLYEEMLAEIA